MKIVAVIVAAGSSGRMQNEIPKVFLPLCGKTVIRRTVEAFENASLISEVIVVCRPQDREKIRTELQGLLKVTNITEGGANRQESVEKGVLQCGCCDYLAIHDGARPLISPSLIDEVCRDAMSHQNAAPAVKVKDTIKIADENRFINGTPNRDFLYQVQTPQIFAYVGYRNALQLAREQGKNFTDDCQLIENAGGKIYLSQGEYTNIKLTTPEDMAVGTAFAGGSKMKIGHGYDVHR
ncbi:MAG: 2-C-methyl-D-erythritol 4-phosphate cytidylyltransferase, partial [Oscillospiraceae bacterium]